MLLVGRCGDLPIRLWQHEGGTVTSVLTTPGELSSLVGLGEHETVATLAQRAPVGDWVALARAIDLVRPVTAVVACEDRWMTRTAAINDALGLGGHSEATVRAAHHKPAWRDRLRTAGVEDVPSAVATSVADVVEFGDTHGWPVIVKPSSGTGSLGVSRVDEPAHAAAAFERGTIAGTSVLVERYLVGTHLVVETWSEGGEHELVTITRDYVIPPRMVCAGYVLPAPLPPAETEAVVAHVFAALTAIGVRNGPAATEVRITADGPRTMECQLRIDGDDMALLAHDVLGTDQLDLWARQLAGQRILPRLRHQLSRAAEAPVHHAIWWAYPDVDGILRGVDGVEEARAMPSVVRVQVTREPGSRVERLSHAESRVVQIRAAHPDPDEALRIARSAASKIRFVVDTAGRPAAVL